MMTHRFLPLLLIALLAGSMFPTFAVGQEPPPSNAVEQIDRLAREVRILLYRTHQHDRAAYDHARTQLQAAIAAWERGGKSAEHTNQLAEWLRTAHQQIAQQRTLAWPMPPVSPPRAEMKSPPPSTPGPNSAAIGEVIRTPRNELIPQPALPNVGGTEIDVQTSPSATPNIGQNSVEPSVPNNIALPTRENTLSPPTAAESAVPMPELALPPVIVEKTREPQVEPAARVELPRRGEAGGVLQSTSSVLLANPPAPFNANPPLADSVPPPVLPPSVADEPNSELNPPAFAPRQIPLPGVEVPVIDNVFRMRTAGSGSDNTSGASGKSTAGQAKINLTEVAARVAGYNSALGDLELKLAADTAFNVPELSGLLTDLEDLCRRRADLLLYENALPEEQRAQLTRLTNPQTATGMLAAQIVRLRNTTQEPALLASLDELSLRLAKLGAE